MVFWGGFVGFVELAICVVCSMCCFVCFMWWWFALGFGPCVVLLHGFSVWFCAWFYCLLWVYMFVSVLVCGAIALDLCLWFELLSGSLDCVAFLEVA